MSLLLGTSASPHDYLTHHRAAPAAPCAGYMAAHQCMWQWSAKPLSMGLATCGGLVECVHLNAETTWIYASPAEVPELDRIERERV